MSGKFEPKTPVELAPPKDDPITLEELAKADGKWQNGPTYVFRFQGTSRISMLRERTSHLE